VDGQGGRIWRAPSGKDNAYYGSHTDLLHKRCTPVSSCRGNNLDLARHRRIVWAHQGVCPAAGRCRRTLRSKRRRLRLPPLTPLRPLRRSSRRQSQLDLGLASGWCWCCDHHPSTHPQSVVSLRGHERMRPTEGRVRIPPCTQTDSKRPICVWGSCLVEGSVLGRLLSL
jgi:hypothetical protein